AADRRGQQTGTMRSHQDSAASESIVCLTRSMCFAAAALLALPSADVSASEYSLNYAIDANGKTDAGKIVCDYDKICKIVPVGFRMSLSISFILPGHSSAHLEVVGGLGCCYSDDANKTFYLDIEHGLLRIPLYEGRARRVNEFVQNRR